MSSRTKKFKRLSTLFFILSVICTLGPAIYFIVAALLSNNLVIQKTAVVGSVFIAIIGSLFCLVSKQFTFRSKIWIILLALFYALESITNVVIIFAVTQIIDELILSPLCKMYKNKYIINKEIDLRE